MTIAFNQIPSNVRKPGVYLEENTSNAIQGLSPTSDQVCILAQKSASGIIAAKIPTRIFSESDAILDFGAASIAHLAARAALIANPNVNLTVTAMDDLGGSAKATGSLTFGTMPTTAGTFYLWIGDVMITTAYAASENGATTAANVCTNAAQYGSILPVTFSPTSNAIAFEAVNAGTCGNMIAISVADYDNDVTVYATVVPMAAGSGDPDVGAYSSAGTVLASVVGGSYSIYVNTIPQTQASHQALTYTKAMVDFVSGPMEQRPAVDVFAVTDLIDTYSNTKTLCGTNLNHGRTSCAYISYASDNLAKTPYWSIAAAYGAVLGSQSDPAIPYDNLPLIPVAPPAVVDRLTRTQQEDLLNNGVAPMIVGSSEQVVIGRAISTYVTNSLSIPDVALLDINTIRTLDYVRYQIKTRLGLRFVRAKLSPRIVKAVKSEVIDTLYLMQGQEIVQNVDTWKTGVIVEVNSGDPTRIDIKVPSNIVSGLHVICGVIDLILG